MKKIYLKDLSLLFIFILLFFPSISLAQTEQQDLQIEKLQKEIKLLDNQIKKSEFDFFNIFTSIIPIVSGIGAARSIL